MLPKGLTTKGPEGSFGGNENIPYTDGASSYTDQNISNCTLKAGVFYRM